MASFQHQITIEFVTTTEDMEGIQSQGAYNRANIQETIDKLIRESKELAEEKIGLIEHRVTNVDTIKIDPSIRRRRRMFFNAGINFNDIKKLWNERYRHINPNDYFNSQEERVKKMEIVNNNRHLIVSSSPGIHNGYVFSLPEADDAFTSNVWNEVWDKLEQNFNNTTAEVIRSTILSKMEGSFEDGLIERIREATINKHVEECNRIIEETSAQNDSQ